MMSSDRTVGKFAMIRSPSLTSAITDGRAVSLLACLGGTGTRTSTKAADPCKTAAVAKAIVGP